MTDIQAIARFMGGRKIVGTPKSEFDFISKIRVGLPAAAIESVSKSSSFSKEFIYKALPIARRTVARQIASGGLLKPFDSELLYRLSCVFVAAKQVLDTAENARQWMTEENRALHGERPLDLLDTGIGFRDVMDVLRRIEFGVYS